ncbi:Tetraspanin-8 [Dissostichus eleginoides]|uniref:Tetraspanin n=1 Tax=Dissostichus eleginoides TaxID=100907 RepID=A0AAD9FHN6_DISEL|nr:Tetraspanin-8 [Dissostichus eleginoides]
MGKINGCIKCLFIFFNVVFALLGCVLVYLAVQATVFSHQVTSVGGLSMALSWVFVLGVFVLPVLGIVAACMEKELVFKIFAGFMVAGMIIMLIFGIVVVVSRNMLENSLDTASAEVAKTFMEYEEMRMMIMAIEESAHCCGVVSSSDWGNKISQSCECKMGNTGFSFSSGCKAKPVGALGPDQIYATSCSGPLFVIFDFIFKIIMGICFTFAILALLLALLMSILMIHQIRKHDSGGSSMAMKSF